MSLPRLVLVLPGGPNRPTSPFYTISFGVHLFLIAMLFVAPAFRKNRTSFTDAMVVDVVGSLPGGPPQAAAAPPPKASPPPPSKPPAPKKEKEGMRTLDKPVAPKDPKKKPEPKKKEEPKDEPEGEGEEQPQGPPQPPAGPAGPAKPGPVGVPGAGGITSLDSTDVEFAWYRAQITSALKGRWVRPILDDASGPIAATVVFDIRRDGSVTDVRIETSSGVSVMDRSVLRAVLEAAPLPALPAAFTEPELSARYEFRFQPGEP